jgi:hypothetical protein
VHCLCQTRNKGHAIKQAEGPARATCTVHGQQQKGLLALMISSRRLGTQACSCWSMSCDTRQERGAESTWTVKRKGQDSRQRFDLVLQVSAL